jgi:hypothetical protein
MENHQFYSSTGIRFQPEEVVAEMLRFMKDDHRRSYKVLIGTDSEVNADDQVDFVTAIVVHRVGNGGRYFWRRIISPRIVTLRDRIWQEVLMSLEVSKGFITLAKNYQIPPFDFEVHIDVGDNGATREMIQELVGVVRAHNFEARTKPDSYAASKVADRHTR